MYFQKGMAAGFAKKAASHCGIFLIKFRRAGVVMI